MGLLGQSNKGISTGPPPPVLWLASPCSSLCRRPRLSRRLSFSARSPSARRPCSSASSRPSLVFSLSSIFICESGNGSGFSSAPVPVVLAPGLSGPIALGTHASNTTPSPLGASL
ncbi:hypothetical protein AAY473_025299 [Plecturocebus cupreus]